MHEIKNIISDSVLLGSVIHFFSQIDWFLTVAKVIVLSEWSGTIKEKLDDNFYQQQPLALSWLQLMLEKITGIWEHFFWRKKLMMKIIWMNYNRRV